MRQLTKSELENVELLTSNSIECTFLEPTETALEKAIIDATAPVRRYLFEKSIHDYGTQGQGAQEHGVNIKAYLLTEHLVLPSNASLYRPQTKKGDPRIWLSGLKDFCKPNDILALIIYNKEIYVLNLTTVPLQEIISKKTGPIWDLIKEVGSAANDVANELLLKLRKICAGDPHRSVMDERADTAIGRTLEHLLGISMNSSRNPDYKGIELKSARSKKGGRKGLFAKTPNWKISKLKRSAEILEHFGYHAEDGTFQLFCTTNGKGRNPNGFQLRVNQKEDLLLQSSLKEGLDDFAVWRIEDLRSALLKKHNETFWIEADCHVENGIEFFKFTKVVHTKKPIISQFDLLLEQGGITLDYTIWRLPSGGAKDKGYLFKVNSGSFGALFPPSKTYILSDVSDS